MTDHTPREAALVRDVLAHLRPGFPVRLWTGEVVNDGPGVRLAVTTPLAISRLMRSPSLSTVIELWADGSVEVERGSVLDLAAAYEAAKAADPRGFKQRLRTLPKAQLLARLPTLLPGAIRAGTGGVLSGQRRFRAGGGKAEIGHHYDVSNDFYRLFLDERLVYTCAYFERPDMTLDEAQAAKLDLVCRKLRLREGEHLLDIGCGWGAMLIHAARHYGVTGLGVTLSEEQAALARERVEAEGLADRVTIELRPFESLEAASFDKISSIGMFEHVGIANHDAYFANVHRLLKPGGLYLHHAITRRMKRSRRAFGRKSAEHRALVRYIFPGGELDTLGMTINGLEARGLEVHDAENLRPHYGRTCREWANRLHARFDEAIAEVGAPRARLWLLYLAGCALAFERGSVQINQTLASRRAKSAEADGGGRALVPVPWTRDDLYASKAESPGEPGPARR